MSRQLLIARLSIALGTLACIALSLPLWLTRTNYPRAPLFEFIPPFPRPFDIVFLIVFATTFLLLVWRPGPARFSILWFAAAGFLVLQDQSRLQPWFVEGVLLLAALASSRNRDAAFNGCRLVVAFMYVWSGIHKMNESFADALFPWLLSHFTKYGASTFMDLAGKCVPFLEMGMGLALLFPRTRRAGVVATVAMHLFLLAVLGPWALGWNSVVWPWNFTMIALTPCLFWRADAPVQALFRPEGNWVRTALLACVLVLPPLSLVEVWDTYPSFSLYSGNPLIGSVVLMPSAWERLDDKTRAVAERTSAGYRIRFDDWSIAATNVPAYPADRVLRRIAKSFCAIHETDNDFVYLIEKPARWFYRPGWHRIEQPSELCEK